MIRRRMSRMGAEVREKEIEIVNLYAKKVDISIEEAEEVYRCSRLRKIIRDKNTALYLESPYFILERYSEYMDPVPIRTLHARHATPVMAMDLMKKR